MFARSSRRRDARIRAELDPVALEPNDELLAGTDADVVAAGGEVRLGGGDEPVALLHECLPVGRIREQVGECSERETLVADVVEDSLLDGVERRTRLDEAVAAGAVREEPVVQLVRCPDPLALDRL